MLTEKPFLIGDINTLRTQILDLESATGRPASLWRMVRNSVRCAPLDFGWYAPFVALMTRDAQDIANARQIIFTYLDKLDPMSFCSGLQYHFWCFAFPHAKVALYFQWLCTIGAFSQDEQAEITAQLIEYHFVNFYYGMRTKPQPECVDNQTLSLCFSNALLGAIFADPADAQPSAMAAIMLRDGLSRLPEVIGDMPASGYSGEGSSYMDCVNGPAIPLAIELLERLTGEVNLLYKPFPPGGACPVNVLRMVAREFMPGGLLLPWDNYGYQYGVRSTLAYGARKTGEDLFLHALEQETIWTYDIGIGWAYDDLVWTLIWWPGSTDQNDYSFAGQTGRPAAIEIPQGTTGRTPGGFDDHGNWYDARTGGTLVSADRNRYLLQMWDESTPVNPTRSHVNPNAVLFAGYGVPLSADGSPEPEQNHRFQFADTWRTVSFLAIDTESRYNYGDGCGGAHSIVIVDDLESMRAHADYDQIMASGYDQDRRSVHADVTPLYQENLADIQTVLRRSQMHEDAFFTVEDWIVAKRQHQIAVRFLLRPGVARFRHGIRLETAEGITLQLLDILQDCAIRIEPVEHHPWKPDRASVIVDFVKSGREIRSLILAFVSRTRTIRQELTAFQVISDPGGSLDAVQAMFLLEQSDTRVPLRLPAYMETDFPNDRTWWYRCRFTKDPGPCWLVLPRGMHAPRLFLNRQEIDLSAWSASMELLAPHVPVPAELQGQDEIEMVLRVEVAVSHYDGGGDGTISFSGGVFLAYPVEEEQVMETRLEGDTLQVITNQRVYHSILHRLS